MLSHLIFNIPRKYLMSPKSGHYFSQVILRVSSYDCGFLYGKVFRHLSSDLLKQQSQKIDTVYFHDLVHCNGLSHTVCDLYQGQFRRISARLRRHINFFSIIVNKYPVINLFKSSRFPITCYFVISNLNFY